jgi:hypothetical protein
MPVLTVFTAPPLPSKVVVGYPPKPSVNQPSTPLPEDDPLQVPTVVLAHESVSDVMAAHLAMKYLGHVLFLKAQIPMYVIRYYGPINH